MFAEEEAIFTYTDAEAVEDGVLVDLSSLNLPLHGSCIDRITVNLLGRIQEEKLPLQETLQHLADCATPDGDPTFCVAYHPKIGRVWIITNERGTYTAMLPEDY